MLDRLAPLAHLLRMVVEPALHRFENMLMLPSGDASSGRREGCKKVLGVAGGSFVL
jgi:hypothetical protein